jgi:predicted component of type VI protein secretion system
MGTEKPQRSTAFLVVRYPGDPDWVAIWDTVEITVGRQEGQDIAVSDAEVSRKHCVFRQKGGVFTLEDLGSALGTRVNGAPVQKSHELSSGDVAEIGSLKVKFGLTTQAVKPGGHVRFASQLKGFGAPDDDPGNRTMMAIDLHDDPLASAAPTLAKQVARARAVSLDGRLEDADAPDLVDPGELGGPPGVRDLDAALAGDFDDGLGPLPPPPVSPIRTSAPIAKPGSPRSATGDVRVQLVLEVAGPAAQVEALVAAIREKPISAYPLTLCVKDPR